MPKTNSLKLTDFFKRFPPRFLLGTTYTASPVFFETSVLPKIDRRKLEGAVILCDRKGFQMAAQEVGALRAASKIYSLIYPHVAGAFHPKVWIMADSERIALLCGSGNMTQSGFIENIELFDAFEIERGGSERELAGEVVGFVEGLIDLWPATDRQERPGLRALTGLLRLAEELRDSNAPAESRKKWFLTSFSGGFAEQLGGILECSEMQVASPYFGGGTGGVAALSEALGAAEVEVFPATHRSGVDLEPRALERWQGRKVRQLALQQPKKGKTGQFPHLKLYGLRGPEGAFSLTGSINATHAALEGPNHEAGILRRIDGDIFEALFAPHELKATPVQEQMEFLASGVTWLGTHAVVRGNSVLLSVDGQHEDRLPLSEVRLQWICGPRKQKAEIGEAFPDHRTMVLRQEELPEWLNGERNAAAVELTGQTVGGEPFRSFCLVESYADLTATPMQRNAAAAIQALLADEEHPAASDLSAVFQLLGRVLEGENLLPAGTGGSGDGKEKKARPPVMPIWPPAAVDESSGKQAHGREAGDIEWFQRILASLLHPGPDVLIKDEPVLPRHQLVSSFLHLMVGDRQQNEDLALPRDHPYGTERFPPVLEDIVLDPELELDRDLAILMVALFVILHLEGGAKGFPLSEWLRFRHFTGPTFQIEGEVREEVIEKAMQYGARGEVLCDQEACSQSLGELLNLGWKDFAGYQRMILMRKAVGGGKMEPEQPFLTADFSDKGGGIDYLGLRLVNLRILAQNFQPPAELKFSEEIHRKEVTSIYAAALYGPSLRYLGFVGYAEGANHRPTRIHLPLDEPENEVICRHVEGMVGDDTLVERIAEFDLRAEEIGELQAAQAQGLHPSAFRDVPEDVEQAVIRRILGMNEKKPNRRHLTTKLIIHTLRSGGPMDSDSLRRVWHTGLLPDGTPMSGHSPELERQRFDWAIFEARQYQRFVLETFLRCFEMAVREGASTLEDVVDVTLGWIPDAPETFDAAIRREAKNAGGPDDLEAASDWRNEHIHGDSDHYEWLAEGEPEEEAGRALSMLCRWILRTDSWLRRDPDKEEFDWGGEGRVSIRWFHRWLAERRQLPLRELLREFYGDLVFTQHLRVALSRLHPNEPMQRLRFVLGDLGIMPTSGMEKKLGKDPAPWMADRLDAWLLLLKDVRILEMDDDGAYRCGRNSDAI